MCIYCMYTRRDDVLQVDVEEEHAMAVPTNPNDQPGKTQAPAATPQRPAECLAPLALRPSIHETIWGGQHLATVAGKTLPTDVAVGETWETELSAVVTSGPHEGETLGALVERYGERLIGSQAQAVFGPRFPLLAKFIDAQRDLSVQVHPEDDYAAAHEGGKLGKTEVWHILHAEPGARVVYGLNREASVDEVRAAIAETRLDTLLATHEVRPGDVIFVPAGTVHAICAGIVLYELQEYSDVTYRLYDYGRLQNGKPRELHIEKSLDVMRFAPSPAVLARTVQREQTHEGTRQVLAASRYFVLEDVRVGGMLALPAMPWTCQIITVLAGRVTLRGAGGAVTLSLGETAVVPAVGGAVTLESAGGNEARLMRSYVPLPDDAALQAWQTAQPEGYAR